MKDDGRAVVCPHMLNGAMPEMLIIEQAVLQVAACHDCAILAETTGQTDSFSGVCRHTHPALPLWNVEEHFPDDGCYQLLDGKYHRQPDMPEEGHA